MKVGVGGKLMVQHPEKSEQPGCKHYLVNINFVTTLKHHYNYTRLKKLFFSTCSYRWCMYVCTYVWAKPSVIGQALQLIFTCTLLHTSIFSVPIRGMPMQHSMNNISYIFTFNHYHNNFTCTQWMCGSEGSEFRS